MKEVIKYQCEICGQQYKTKNEAAACEAVPIKHDKGVKVDDLVLILTGEGRGHKLRVREVFVHSPNWGPARFAHSVALSGDVIDSWGSRQLTYDSYEVLK